MSAAELRVVREFLPGEWLAGHLGVQGRTWRRWEAGTVPIPDGVRIEIERLEQIVAATVGEAVRALSDVSDPGVLTYRHDAQFHAAHPGIDYPASWHRAIIARVAQEVPGLPIRYADPARPPTGTHPFRGRPDLNRS